MKKLIIHISLCFSLLLMASPAIMAQPGFDDDVQDTPIDGGVGLLLAAGVGYGFKKLRDKKNEEYK